MCGDRTNGVDSSVFALMVLMVFISNANDDDGSGNGDATAMMAKAYAVPCLL
jgi:hypothetical protein